MPWIEAAAATVEAAKLASEVANSQSRLRKFAHRLLFRLKNGRSVIPIFGASGVGKSTIGTVLAEQATRAPKDLRDVYDESMKVEELNLKGDIPGKVLVGPGQPHRADVHWPDLYKKIVDGEALGIINMVSYGYHSFNINRISEHSVFKTGMSKEQFLQKYCAFRRGDEIEMLKTLIAGVSALKRPIWMVTVVNKQDIWWKSSGDVRNHYEHGEYAALVNSLGEKIGKRSFQHEFIPASLTVENFVTKEDGVLAEVAAGYDMSHHYSSKSFVIEKIDELAERGKPKNA